MTVGIIGKTENAEVDNTVPFSMLLSENVSLNVLITGYVEYRRVVILI